VTLRLNKHIQSQSGVLEIIQTVDKYIEASVAHILRKPEEKQLSLASESSLAQH
jgi:hypothetical protein